MGASGGGNGRVPRDERWRFRVQLEYLGAIAPPFDPWNATRYRQRNEKAPGVAYGPHRYTPALSWSGSGGFP